MTNTTGGVDRGSRGWRVRKAIATVTVLMGLFATHGASASGTQPAPLLPASAVPPAGEGLFAEVIRSDGFAVSQLVGEGVWGVPRDADEFTGEVTACLDDAHSLWGWRESQPHGWYFNPSSVPPGLDAAGVLKAATEATDGVTAAANSCARSDSVSATSVYHGATTAGTNITTAGTCATRDGRSVVGFGLLDTRALAVACVWFSTTTSPWEVIESDIRLSTSGYSWFTERPVPCANRYDLQSVLAHERGHTFGLGHVSERDHPAMTMSEMTASCSMNARTLGLGDVLGLERLY